jgi:hypothetical protein
MKQLLTFLMLIALVILQNCRPQEIEEPLPEYMFARFQPGKPCHDVDYMILRFPDSTLVLSDTMSRVRKFDGFGAEEASVGFAYYLEPFDPSISFQDNHRFTIYFSDDHRPIKNIDHLVQIGAYKFYDRFIIPNEELYNGGAQIYISFHSPAKYILYSIKQSNYFHLTNKSGSSYQLKICGTFDLEMDYVEIGGAIGPIPEKALRLQGEFSITMIDSFFR